MLFALMIITGAIVGIFAKGKFSNLLNVKLNKVWLILGAFGFELIVQIASKKIEFNTTFTLLFQFVILVLLTAGFWFNRDYIGICVLTLGFYLNSLVIMLNGGKMPVSLEVVKKAGLIKKINDIDIKHFIFSDSGKIKLPFLADVIRPPHFLSYGMEVISIGDVIIAIGLFVLVVEMLIGKKFKVGNGK